MKMPSERVAGHGHVGGQGAEDRREQRAEDGVADGGERAHEAGLQRGDGLEAVDALGLLDGEVDARDDRVEEVGGVEERRALGAAGGLQGLGVVPIDLAELRKDDPQVAGVLHTLVVPASLEADEVADVDLTKVSLRELVAGGLRAHRRHLPPYHQRQSRRARSGAAGSRCRQGRSR